MASGSLKSRTVMAKKFLYIIAGLILLVLAGAFILSLWGDEVAEVAFRPSEPFETQPALADNAYADDGMWFAKSGNQALVDWLPRGFDGEDADALSVPVFFIHPTSYLIPGRWNAPLDDEDSQERARLFVRAMASPFARAGDVWVPRYRQAAFGAFLTTDEEGEKAIDIAYRDIASAFDRFLAELPPSQRFVLAGHSQGSLHLLRLLAERIEGTPLADRVVAAYAIGWPVSIEADLPALGLPPCEQPDQTGCLISWQSYAEPADYARTVDHFESFAGLNGQSRRGSHYLCFNPLRHTTGGSAPAKDNAGTLVPDGSLADAEMVKGAVPARCDEKGFLLIGDPPDVGPYVLPGNNYHLYDIALFWRDLRSDVETRVRAIR